MKAESSAAASGMPQTGFVAMSKHVEERLSCPDGSKGEGVEESKGRYKSGKIKITTSSFLVACCRNAAFPEMQQIAQCLEGWL